MVRPIRQVCGRPSCSSLTSDRAMDAPNAMNQSVTLPHFRNNSVHPDASGRECRNGRPVRQQCRYTKHFGVFSGEIGDPGTTTTVKRSGVIQSQETVPDSTAHFVLCMYLRFLGAERAGRKTGR
jgi:hypothetical protein